MTAPAAPHRFGSFRSALPSLMPPDSPGSRGPAGSPNSRAPAGSTRTTSTPGGSSWPSWSGFTTTGALPAPFHPRPWSSRGGPCRARRSPPRRHAKPGPDPAMPGGETPGRKPVRRSPRRSASDGRAPFSRSCSRPPTPGPGNSDGWFVATPCAFTACPHGPWMRGSRRANASASSRPVSAGWTRTGGENSGRRATFSAGWAPGSPTGDSNLTTRNGSACWTGPPFVRIPKPFPLARRGGTTRSFSSGAVIPWFRHGSRATASSTNSPRPGLGGYARFSPVLPDQSRVQGPIPRQGTSRGPDVSVETPAVFAGTALPVASRVSHSFPLAATMIATPTLSEVARACLRRGARLLVLGAAVTVVLVGCDSSPSAPQVASVRVDAPLPVVVVGETIQLTAVALDAAGNPIPGQSATWSSSAPQVFEVDGSGRVSGVSAGSALARAEIAGVTGSRTIQVLPRPVADVVVAPTEVELARGDVVQLVVTLRDDAGNELTGRPVTFQSANQSIAMVTSDGLVQGMQAGTTQITVRSGDASTVVPVTVLPGDEPSIQSISPGTVQEGMEIEITGQRFSPSPSLNVVRIGGATATVLEASATRLRVRTPAQICMPSGIIQVVVEVAGEASAPFQAPFEAGDPVSLAVGELELLTGSAAGCLRLPGTTSSSSYLVGIQSTSGNPDVVTPVSVTGTRGQSASSPDAAAMPGAGPQGALQDSEAGSWRPSSRVRSTSFPAVARARMAAASGAQAHLDHLPRHHAAEARLREREREIMTAPMAAGTPFRAGQRALLADGAGGDLMSGVRVPASVQVGDTLTVNIPDIRPDSNFCTTGIPVQVVVRRVGSGGIWLEDVLNPPPGLSAGDYSTLGAQFDDVTLPRLRSHFGEPTDLDGNGRIVIVISQQVNRFGGILGFVVSTDFAPVTSCPASNQGEFYYSITPDPDGVIPAPTAESQVRFTLDDFRSETPRLAAHETTHIIQFGRRLQAGASAFGTIWELEGQAVLGEEVVGFDALGLGPRQNLGFGVAFNSPETSPVDWFANAFEDLAVYYGFETRTTRTAGAPAACSWLGRRDVSGPCDWGRLAYGVSWSFLRWLSDHYGDQFAGGEAELQRRLVEASVAGFPAIEQVVGVSRSPLLAYWAASLYTDGRLPPGADPRLSFPSWDLRSIDGALVEPARLQPQTLSFNGFTTTRSVAAASSHYMTVSGPSHPSFAIRTTTQAGTSLPAHMQVWVVRLQ
ncbi:MAG: hypothetical protein EA350_12175 [Gemmatimonadales bacterium]|nr:MAG: hypothetical protein EA350_12175 [Gemmatimonadales bacterium]